MPVTPSATVAPTVAPNTNCRDSWRPYLRTAVQTCGIGAAHGNECDNCAGKQPDLKFVKHLLILRKFNQSLTQRNRKLSVGHHAFADFGEPLATRSARRQVGVNITKRGAGRRSPRWGRLRPPFSFPASPCALYCLSATPSQSDFPGGLGLVGTGHSDRPSRFSPTAKPTPQWRFRFFCRLPQQERNRQDMLSSQCSAKNSPGGIDDECQA